MVGNERRHLVVLRMFGRAGGFGRVGKADQEDRCGGRNADEQAEAKREAQRRSMRLGLTKRLRLMGSSGAKGGVSLDSCFMRVSIVFLWVLGL